MMSAKEDKTLVTFWGTRGSISTPGRMTEKYGGNTPCVTVRHGDIFIIFDAGTGIRNLGIEIMHEFSLGRYHVPLHLFISHTHWDHIQGLPFFQPAYEKDIGLTIYGSHQKERFLGSILKEQMDFEYFPVAMSSFAADIKVHEMKKIVYATDVELNRVFQGEGTSKQNPNLAQDYLDFIADADLLIGDGQYTQEEYPEKRKWGHTSIPVLLETAFKSRVKKLAIFHHDPQHSDKFLDEIWSENRTRFRTEDMKMEVFCAREGMTIAV
ncbi:MAG: MBL fold metallo-hydrolase [Deltaproteobacteria bacterium]|nr:MBL fold metallo-hydrolase [Deltaproteobacteria bacterium]